MEDPKPIKITITNSEGQECTITTHWGSDIYVWRELLKTVLTFLTFLPQTINEILPEESINGKREEE